MARKIACMEVFYSLLPKEGDDARFLIHASVERKQPACMTGLVDHFFGNTRLNGLHLMDESVIAFSLESASSS